MKSAPVAKIKLVGKLDPRSNNFAKEFRRAAADFRSEHLTSPEKALAVLVEAGIYTTRGKLTKNYR